MKSAFVVLGVSLASLAPGRVAFGQAQRQNDAERNAAKASPPQPSAAKESPPQPSSAAGSASAVHCVLAGGTPPKDESSEACLSCHGKSGPGPLFTHSHPVNVEYAAAHERGKGTLRALDAVTAKGVALPGGKLQCVTCHDAKSQWAKWIALPTGAVARPAADRRASKLEDAPNWRIAPAVPPPPPAKGTEIISAPLCAACHTFAD